MKTLMSVLIIVAFMCSGLVTAGMMEDAEGVEEIAPPSTFLCPVSQMSDNARCMNCHQMVLENGKPTFGLKEILLEAAYEEKPFNLKIQREYGEVVGYHYLTNIVATGLEEIKRYLYEHPEIKKLIIDIHSGGGDVMAAWKIVGSIQEMQSRGIEVETRCYGIAASAGGIILIAGSPRSVSPTAEIMIHKVWQFKMFSVDDPDSSADKTEMLEHFQANINRFFESRTNIKTEELNDKTRYKMWWITGSEAIELGIADKLIGE